MEIGSLVYELNSF